MKQIDSSMARHAVGADAAKPVHRLTGIAAALCLLAGSDVQALPVLNGLTNGFALDTPSAGKMVVKQFGASVIAEWRQFDIGKGESVTFDQPSQQSVMLNRVLGAQTTIDGSLNANGKVFLVNPNGIVFTKNASVNVGSLVASSLSISNEDFIAGRYRFTGTGTGTVVNEGNISAVLNSESGGYIALLGGQTVRNSGTITASMGTVAMAAGKAMTLDLVGDRLINVQVSQDTANALVENGGMIMADGGLVLMTTQAAGSLLATTVNNEGTIQARSVSSENGTIWLLAGMSQGEVKVGGTLDVSVDSSRYDGAGGSAGGIIRTAAGKVTVQDAASINPAAERGELPMGTWRIVSDSFTVGGNDTAAAGANISGQTMANALLRSNVIISTDTGMAEAQPALPASGGNAASGDIHIDAPLNWGQGKRARDSQPYPDTSLFLQARRDVNINAGIRGSGGSLTICCGRDINVNAEIFLNRPLTLSAGRDLNIRGDVGTGGENSVLLCAARDFNVGAEIFMNTGNEGTVGYSSLSIVAGYGAGAPGEGGGRLRFLDGGKVTIQGTTLPATISYNPSSYATPTDFSRYFTTEATQLTQSMLVYPQADKTYDGSNAVVLSTLKGEPDGARLIAGPNSQASFSDAGAGNNKLVSFSGYTMAENHVGEYALPISCCDGLGRTTGNIALPPVIPPVIPPVTPPVTPPVIPPVTPPVTPPVIPPVTPPSQPAITPVPPRIPPVSMATPPQAEEPPLEILRPTMPPLALNLVQRPMPPARVAPQAVPTKPRPAIPAARPRKQDRN